MRLEAMCSGVRLRWLARGCETALWIAGLAATGCFVGSLVYAKLYQSQASRIFDARKAASGAPAALDPLLGRLQIPAIGLSVMVLEGTDSATLARGVGHIAGTSTPAAGGNVGIAGHRDTFFRSLGRIAKDDRVVLTTLGGRFEYRVSEVRIVEPEDSEVLRPTDEAALTLVTCYPFQYVGSAPQRYVVRAERSTPDEGVER